MTLTLDLPPDLESALTEDARRKGTTPAEMILEELRQKYFTPDAGSVVAQKPVSAMVALFAQWDAEDATDDPEEIARRNQEWEETKANLAANRMNFEGRTDFRAILGDAVRIGQE